LRDAKAHRRFASHRSTNDKRQATGNGLRNVGAASAANPQALALSSEALCCLGERFNSLHGAGQRFIRDTNAEGSPMNRLLPFF
jgi:hypothetical protein